MNIKPFLFTLMCISLLSKASAQNNPITFQRTAKGALYHIYTPNTGDKIKLNDVVTFFVIEKTDKDSVLYSSRVNKGGPEKAQVQPSKTIADIMDIFPLLALKDSAIVKIPTDSVFTGHEDQRPPFLPKGTNLVFVLKIDRIQSLDDAMAERNAAVEAMKSAESAAIKKYIGDKHLMFKTTPSGLNYIITQPSIKRKALAGDTAYVNYTGHNLTGKVFDSSVEADAVKAGLKQPGRTYEPLKVVVGHGDVIKGWDEALLLLNEGSKATLLIPSALAYGERGASEDIPAYSPLVFDMQVVKIKPARHTALKPTAKKVVKKSSGKTSAVVKKKQ